jgi:peptide subunit release factor 1 (eRF1)
MSVVDIPEANVPPVAPANLVATPADSAVQLSWNGSAGADSYLVKRSTTSGSGYTNIATGVTATSFTDTGLVNGDSEREEIVEQAMDLLEEVEREEEEDLWQRVRSEILGGGLAVGGPKEVLNALREGRVETLLVDREVEIEGMRCRDCELLAHAKPKQCPSCKSTSVFHVDLVNELVELAEKTSAASRFTDPIDGLTELGGVAATLRY